MRKRSLRSGEWCGVEMSCSRAMRKIGMDERGASTDHVCNALLTAKGAAHDPERDRWKVTGGTDREGDVLKVVVAIEADVIVVTLF
jgi:hypothetical protein